MMVHMVTVFVLEHYPDGKFGVNVLASPSSASFTVTTAVTLLLPLAGSLPLPPQPMIQAVTQPLALAGSLPPANDSAPFPLCRLHSSPFQLRDLGFLQCALHCFAFDSLSDKPSRVLIVQLLPAKVRDALFFGPEIGLQASRSRSHFICFQDLFWGALS